MTHSTGRTCEAVKQFIAQNDDVLSCFDVSGKILSFGNLNETLQNSLNKAGCDWPVCINQGNEMKIYFSRCDEQNVVCLECTTKLPGHVDYLRSLIVQKAGAIHQQSA